MSSVGSLPERIERPALVQFKKVPVQDNAASLKAGHYVGRDVDFVEVLQPGSRDVHETKAETFFQQKAMDVRNGRLQTEILEAWKKKYAAWQQGQELPPDGEPIRGWSVISPAMMNTLLSMNILTVEDLAAVNDEAMKRIGMGALDLKNKAVSWLRQREDKAPLVMEVSALKTENANLRADLTAMKNQLDALAKRAEYLPPLESAAPVAVPSKPAIGVNDILTDGDADPDTSE